MYATYPTRRPPPRPPAPPPSLDRPGGEPAWLITGDGAKERVQEEEPERVQTASATFLNEGLSPLILTAIWTSDEERAEGPPGSAYLKHLSGVSIP